MRRRRSVIASLLRLAASRSNSVMRPRVGLSESSIRRIKVVLPAPEGPVRNWNDCGPTSKLISFRISAPMPYLRPTFSNRTKRVLVAGIDESRINGALTITAEHCSRRTRGRFRPVFHAIADAHAHRLSRLRKILPYHQSRSRPLRSQGGVPALRFDLVRLSRRTIHP